MSSPPPEGQTGRTSTLESSIACYYKKFRCGKIFANPPGENCVLVSTTLTIHVSIEPNPGGVLCPVVP